MLLSFASFQFYATIHTTFDKASLSILELLIVKKPNYHLKTTFKADLQIRYKTRTTLSLGSTSRKQDIGGLT